MPTAPIIIKKKVVHGGHHGGAWKVAYADFVTAMMALFIVLWLLNTSKQIQEAIGGYFKDPSGTAKKVGTNLAGSGENFQVTKQNMSEIKEQLQKRLRSINDLEKLRKNIEMTVTAEGLRIELLESEKGTFFDSGSPKLNGSGQEILVLLAKELGAVPNRLSIEGHTDAKPYGEKSNYGNWELSADRANAARRLMSESGLHANQVDQVRGFADQRLRNPKDPLEASNRRVSIIVQYLPNDSPPEEPELKPGEHKGEAGEKPSAAATEGKTETAPTSEEKATGEKSEKKTGPE
jgi:chemotaxis protein MotB